MPPSSPRDRALVCALLARDWAPTRTLALFLCLVPLALWLGRRADSLGLVTNALYQSPSASPSTASLSTFYLALVPLAALYGAGFATLRLVIDRLARDHDSGWPLPILAAGLRRDHLAFVTVASALSLTTATFSAGFVAFTSASVASGHATSSALFPQWLGSVAFLCACGIYGGIVALLTQPRSRATLVALAAIVIPIGAMGLHRWSTGIGTPAWLHALLTMHLPVQSAAGSLSALLSQLVYLSLGAALLRTLALRGHLRS